MKSDSLNLLLSPRSGKKLYLKNEVMVKNKIKSGVIFDEEGNEYKIVDFIPRFVRKTTGDNTASSFGYKWKTFVKASLNKQEKNIKIFLDDYGWDLNEFRNFLSTRKRILDVGCGTGYISNWISSETNAEVFGVDISTSVDEARKHFCSNDKQNLQFIQADIAELPFKNEFFDLIVCKEVIHHTPEPRKNFSKLANLLAPGGVIHIYVYKKKGPIREFCDDYVRAYTTKLSVEECSKFAEVMTELGKSLREMNVTIKIPKDIPYLNIPAGNYDLQRFIYLHMFKCWWDDEEDRDYSNAVNFDWYHPQYAFRYTEDEIKEWFIEEGIKIENLNVLEAGIAIRGIKSLKYLQYIGH